MQGRQRRLARTALLLLTFASTLSGVGSGARAGGTLLEGRSVSSNTLGRDIPYLAYVPSIDVATHRWLPVLYLLHGRGDTERAWVDNGAIVATLDREIAAGTLQPLVVIMPAAGNSWYVDDAQPGRFGDVAKAFTEDLIAGVELQLPLVAPCRSARAIGGLSMGGYGALLYAVDRPDLYTAAFSLSGSLFQAEADYIESRRDVYERIYGGVFGTPFDTQRYLAWNIFQKLAQSNAADRLPPFWLSAGTRDFPAILDGTKHMHAFLRQRGVSSELSIAEGDHTWPFWSEMIVQALRWMSPKLSAKCPAHARVPD
jgi:S-formylglutathione hydrolase FrmB